ncbi:glycosyltransferase family 10 [Amylibacter sp.]|nr:glycosyltransferase family 10 [Amylibacter sp.]
MNSNSQEPAIAIIPYGSWPTLGLRNMPLDRLEWPIGRPERLRQGTVSSLTEKDHLITFPRKPVFFLSRYKVKANISLMIVEPDSIHNHYLKLSKYFYWRFYKILTKNKQLLNILDNGSFFYLGSTFLRKIDKIDIQKNNLASLIASSQNELKGHKLRHKIAKYIKNNELNIAVIGRGYKPFENKEDGLKSFRYSIVIENSSEQDYFTEKVVDACLLETIPIYWGAPNISKYFDIRGFIVCNSSDEIVEALKNLSIKDYNRKIKWIKKNKETALYHANYMKRAALIIKEHLKH